jgi:hypothetical protein
MTHARYALDHVFVCCAEGAPEAQRLARLGLSEGSSNTHPGQGTASRRFFFENAYLELFWVADAREAQAELAAPTRLWSRWSARSAAASPFAVILHPGDGADAEPPFASWAYHPPYLPPHLAIDVAEGTPLSEPAFFYIGFARGAGQMQPQPRDHALGLRRLTAVEIGLPGAGPRSDAARIVEEMGLVQLVVAPRHRMTLTFDDGHTGKHAVLDPDLPLVLRW